MIVAVLSVQCKWKMAVITGEQLSCICDQSSLSGLTRREVAEDKHRCLTARWDAACVYSHCAELRGAVWRSWMQLVWDSSGWTVADMLRRSRLSEATLLQLDTSKGRVAGRRRMDKRLDSFPPCSHLTLCIVRWFIFSPLQFPAYHFLWRHTHTLKERRSSDPPGSLQGGPRLINWQPFDIVQSVWPPALQAGLPLCVLATLLSPQLFTLVI